MLNFDNFFAYIATSPFQCWLETLPKQLNEWLSQQQQDRRFRYWQNAVNNLPLITPSDCDLLNGVSAKTTPPLSTGAQQHLTSLLRLMIPWRKGPFELYGVNIETEWRSDWKWERLKPFISSLKDKSVLDVGCGSGYHLWRMIGEGAKFAVGIDPMSLYFCQFHAVKKLLASQHHAYFLPLCLEELAPLAQFNTVFSMGVLYHRRSPLDHLLQLKNQLLSGGELILETLVIEGDENQVLMPADRYAQMPNIYFIPSCDALILWLKKCGFVDIKVANICPTTTEEQHKTEWMNSDSLAQFLDPNNRNKTIEGYPAPLRAVIIAKKP